VKINKEAQPSKFCKKKKSKKKSKKKKEKDNVIDIRKDPDM